uniref:Homing endonuclease LAGLIDADG domain-containing protein n=1 Tax=Wolfiporia cocos TaxID=81056 RepID=A0A7G7YDX6_9APHY|nr:hypothetical protein [Wolfiporia cocos]
MQDIGQLGAAIITTGNIPDKKVMAMFMGLVDGDGYIEVTVQKQYSKNPNRKPKSTIRLRLVIRLHNRDRYLLTYLRETLGVGSIDYIKNKNQTRYIICKRDLVRVIAPHTFN